MSCTMEGYQSDASAENGDRTPSPIPSWQFADEFEEYQARASSGGSLIGMMRRQAFIGKRPSPTGSPIGGSPNASIEAARRRPRSKSLAPGPVASYRSLLPTFAVTRKVKKSGHSASTENLREETNDADDDDDEIEKSPPVFRHPRRFSAACVDARDITCKHNIKVSISPPVANLRCAESPWESFEPSDTEETSVASSDEPGHNLIELDKLMPPDLSALIANMPDEPIPSTYRRRSFSITPKGSIINEGDFYVSRADNTIVPALSVETDLDLLQHWSTRSRNSSLNSGNVSPGCSIASSIGDIPLHRVLMLGITGVGKTALTQQFMTSEYMGAQNVSFDGELELSVSILLDGEEAVLEFVDLPDTQGCGKRDAEAFLVIFSVTDKKSFERASELLHDLRVKEGNTSAVILVANKTDLKRARIVPEAEAKKVALEYDCKYSEVSAALNHMVDELLVGILKQIRLNPERHDKAERRRKSRRTADGSVSSAANKCDDLSCLRKAQRSVLSRLLKGTKRLSKSCENLLIL